MNFIVREPRPEDKEAWFAMWPDYITMSQPPSQDILEATWERLLDSSQNPHGLFLYNEENKELAGFLHYVAHATTKFIGERCYMEDVYIAPKYRGQKGFSLLYNHLKDMRKTQNWQKIYWVTDPENTHAQTLYNRIAEKARWIRYEDNFETS